MNQAMTNPIAAISMPSHQGKSGRTPLPPCGPFDFELPASLEASEPPEARGLARDGVRLMVSRIDDDSTMHLGFRDIADVLRSGDVLVINTSGTMNAAIEVHDPGGRPLEMHLSTRLGADEWVVELRQFGEKTTAPFLEGVAGWHLQLPGGGTATLDRAYSRGGHPRLWRARLDIPKPLQPYLAEHGSPIRYGYVRERWPLEYYQTVFATEIGSAEMPSAGRAFTPELTTRLVAHGVEIVPVLLHTGVGSLEEGEEPYPEYYRASTESARRITNARAEGRRIIAVGTTVVRTLETLTEPDGITHAGAGWTDVVVGPPRVVRGVDGLLTGFHEPRASHLLMLAAIAGCRHLRIAYDEALRQGHLWHEFGDLHLILPGKAELVAGERRTVSGTISARVPRESSSSRSRPTTRTAFGGEKRLPTSPTEGGSGETSPTCAAAGR
jgi:S-adenosylmethionine:tRNA ribosyltransferase-isomerase